MITILIEISTNLDCVALVTPDVDFTDVAGLEDAKQALREAITIPLLLPHLFTGNRVAWKGILLYGPPGTGKSFLAKAAAGDAGKLIAFLPLSTSDLVSKWVGESEKLVRATFQVARENKPCIIFIDEIESLCSARSENESDASRRIKTEFLSQMDGAMSDNQGVLVLAATNLPHFIDNAILRRFERRIYIPLPDYAARKQLFEFHIGDTPHCVTGEDIDLLAKNSEGYSGADISVIVRDALMEPIRILQSSTHFKKIKGQLIQNDVPTLTEFFTPCSPGDSNAKEMSWQSVPSYLLYPPPVTVAYLLNALRKTHPTVTSEAIKSVESFQFASTV